MESDIGKIIIKLRKFNSERDWEQFHDKKNLSIALSIEAAELNECFLWKDNSSVDKNKVKEELADVFLYAFMLADKFNFDVTQICEEKIALNAQKYPIEKSKGNATKYSEL